MDSLQVVVRLWIHTGRVAEFEAYERKAARVMRLHGGRLYKTVRIEASASPSSEDPFEVHILEFPSREAFLAYRGDPDLLALAPDRTVAVAKTEVLLGTCGPQY